MKLNLNTILFVLGALGVFAPDVLGLAVYLSSLHLAFLVPIVKALGWLATAMGGLAIAVPRLRAKLAVLGLATPPGAQAPWIPGKDAGVVPMAAPSSGVVSTGIDRSEDITGVAKPRLVPPAKVPDDTTQT